MSTLPPVSRLTDALQGQGLPVLCVSTNLDGTYTVYLLPGSTAAQQQQANQFAANYVDAPTQAAPLVSIITSLTGLEGLGGLLSGNQQKLYNAAIAYVLQQNPSLATTAGVTITLTQPGT